MALIIFGFLLTACFLSYQGLSTLWTGRAPTFFQNIPPSPLKPVARVAYALLLLLPSAGIFSILLTALARAGTDRVRTWLSENGRLSFGALFLLIVGVLSLLNPERMLRWTIRDHPELADNSTMVFIWRLIGIGLLVMGAVMLAKI